MKSQPASARPTTAPTPGLKIPRQIEAGDQAGAPAPAIISRNGREQNTSNAKIVMNSAAPIG